MQYRMKIIIDTNVLVSALKSRRGASFKLISMLPQKYFTPVVSVPLVVEYEAVLKRMVLPAAITPDDIDDVIDYFCEASEHQDIYYLWRPFLPDPFDDHILEAAVASACDAIITYNKSDFKGIDRFGLKLLDPREFLIEMGILS